MTVPPFSNSTPRVDATQPVSIFTLISLYPRQLSGIAHIQNANLDTMPGLFPTVPSLDIPLFQNGTSSKMELIYNKTRSILTIEIDFDERLRLTVYPERRQKYQAMAVFADEGIE